MFSMKSIEAMISENNSEKPSSSKAKKPKRKRRSSKRESDRYNIPGIQSEGNHCEKENQVSNAPHSLNLSTNNKPMHHIQGLPQITNPISKKKRLSGLKTDPKALHVKKNVMVKNCISGVKKKKKKQGRRAAVRASIEDAVKTDIKLSIDHEKTLPELENEELELFNNVEQESDSSLDAISGRMENVKFSGNGFSSNNVISSRKEWTLNKIAKKTSKAPFYEEFGQQQTHGLSIQEKRELMFQRKEEIKAKELTEKQKLISHPLEIFVVEKDRYILVFLPEQSLYVQGVLSLQPLVGNVSVLGYNIDEMEKQDLFSLETHALLSVKAVQGFHLDVSQHTHLLDHGLKSEELQSLADRQLGPVVVLALHRSNHPVVSKLSVIGQTQLILPLENKCEANLYGVLVRKENCMRYNLTEEAAVWRELKENISMYYECGNAPRIVLCGGKGVGKSTLFR